MTACYLLLTLQVPSENPAEVKKRTILMACDALAWQSLASVIVPGFTINRLCWASRLTLITMAKLPKPVSSYISVAMGLAAIPFIIKPIDNAVDHCMNLTLRPWLFKTKDWTINVSRLKVHFSCTVVHLVSKLFIK